MRGLSSLCDAAKHIPIPPLHAAPSPQIRLKDPGSGRMVDDYWEASKKMLMEDDFLGSLRKYGGGALGGMGLKGRGEDL